mmetsp:Transcript_16058/g.34723  ORF Transcript_16058/g.34723 Transcript_16058/m.34723 type:complete len:366 (-) Transcript_16058:923-2020(-)|eukprot:CAMPEP_0202910224 /NCGR_PEP_ID=MMETSP1392-20130828/51457_1 /ASSEMBLY_ACC=CAM_ASM_000868 /TAXON_ID=225041 /ORGANISM="Chlamydomonas chlamydogama, Strain SAG 11-48b" /LENGTH=365 /DNA_ID=CAMNT_0049600267 /DNA_START=52 /DNA_END=1149 /DNA_ORIENTATION=+
MSSTAQVASTSGSENKFDFLPRVSFLPWEWRSLGGALGADKGSKTSSTPTPSLSGRCSFVVRQGFDPTDQSSTGRVLEGNGDMGITLRSKSLAVSLTTSNISLRTGLDNPLTGAKSVGEGCVPSLKATVSKEFSDDQFVALSYDFKLKKPEVALCWSGETFTEKATVCVTADPIYRTVKLGAAVSLPGPEWRGTVYDEDKDVIEEPKDDGGRHRLWVQHEAKHRDWMHRTRAGITVDLGRLVNYVCDVVDYRLEPHFPPLFWALPLSQKLYNLLVPAEDEEQMRHHIKGWDLEVSHDFARRAPRLGLAKNFKFATISASYDLQDKELGLEYSRAGLRLGARLAKLDGMGWKSPSLHLHVEPLSLL